MSPGSNEKCVVKNNFLAPGLKIIFANPFRELIGNFFHDDLKFFSANSSNSCKYFEKRNIWNLFNNEDKTIKFLNLFFAKIQVIVKVFIYM